MGAPVRGHSEFCCLQLEAVFHDCFFATFNTRLVGGAPEPLYQPASRSGEANLLHYREDYFASALHEVAHWCIAGKARRALVDFGYWYAPDGRDANQQRAFEAVECKPQAMEWHFARACGYRFRLSLDNLDGSDLARLDGGAFKSQVVAQARHWHGVGLPHRAARFARALRAAFRPSECGADFTPAELD